MMSKEREALKIALEALEVASSCVDGYYIPIGKSHLPEVEQAIAAIREALAQPEQEPVAWKEAILGAISCDVGVEVPIRDYKSMNPLDCYEAGLLDGGEAVRKTIKDEVTKSLAFYSEPVAWGHPNTSITGRKQALMMVALEIPSNAQYPQMWLPLYTTPPQRKPLTDEQAVWSLNVDELAIYRENKRFAELDEGNSNDSWREALRAGSEIVRLLNAAPQPSKPLTDEQIADLYFDKFSMGELKAFARAIEAAHGIKGKNT